MDNFLGGDHFNERLILVNTSRDYSTKLEPNLNFATKAETYQLWPALKFESWVELLNELDNTVQVGRTTIMKALLAFDLNALRKRGCNLNSCGIAYILGKCDPKSLLAVLPKNKNGEMQIDDFVHFDFFHNCSKVYKGSDLYNQAMRLVYSRMESAVNNTNSLAIDQHYLLTTATSPLPVTKVKKKLISLPRDNVKRVSLSKVVKKKVCRITTFSNIEYSLLDQKKKAIQHNVKYLSLQKKKAAKDVVEEPISQEKGAEVKESHPTNIYINTDKDKDATQEIIELQCNAFPADISPNKEIHRSQENAREISSSTFTLIEGEYQKSCSLPSGSKLNPIIL